jgi:hypothetical protein
MPGEGRSTGTFHRMARMLVGYARCSTDDQDLTAQRDALVGMGVEPKRIYVDHGLTGTNRARPGLREALAACHKGDTLVVTKLDLSGASTKSNPSWASTAPYPWSAMTWARCSASPTPCGTATTWSA